MFRKHYNSPDHRIVICVSRKPAGTHERSYNAATVNEVAVLMPNDPVGQRDIKLHTGSDQLQGISVLHRAYVQQLKSVYEFAKGQFPSYKIVIIENLRPTGEHKGRYNAPTHDVAILMPNDPVGHRDNILYT